MTKHKFMRVAMSVLSVMILIGVALMIYMLSNSDDNIIKLNIKNGETQAVEFKNLCLLPGEECEYIISIRSDMADKYDLRLLFHETEQQELKNYVYVRIESRGEIICDQLLSSLFESNGMTLNLDFNEESQRNVKVVYYMPKETGNEAQNTEATFELLITANNK